VIPASSHQLNRTSPEQHVNSIFKSRVTSEGEGIEP
jgi:hypothetical protein